MIINKKTKFFLAKLLVLFFMFNSSVLASNQNNFENSTDLSLVLNRIEKNISSINSIQTNFIQEKKMVVFNQKIVLKGKIFIEKPKLFAWHVSEPIRYSLVIKENSLSQWDEDTNQVQNISLGKNPALKVVIAQMKEWISGTYSNLTNEYSIEIYKQNPISLKFTPLKNSPSEKIINYVIVSFKDDEHYIASIEIEEKNKDNTIINFLDININNHIDSAAWDAKPHVK